MKRLLIKLASGAPLAGDLLLSHNVKIKGLKIPQYHYAIMGNDGMVIEAVIGKGVTKVPYEKWARANTHTIQEVVGATKKQRRNAVRIAESMVGKPYGAAKAVGAFIAPGKFNSAATPINEKTMFCSGVVGAAYPDIGKTKGKHVTSVMPWDVHHSPHVKNKDGSKKKFVSKKKMIAAAALATAVPAIGYATYRKYHEEGSKEESPKKARLEIPMPNQPRIGPRLLEVRK